MKDATAQQLSDTLVDLETARENVENAPPTEKAAAADEYMRVRAASSPVFAQAQSEYELEQAGASTPGTDTPTDGGGDPLSAEAAPGVPLIAPPEVLVHPDNLDRYGPLVKYWSKTDPTAAPIEATPYAFAPNTAVQTEDGEVATRENSRIIRSEAPVLAVITQAEFDAAFTSVDPATAQPADGSTVTGDAPAEPPAAETPAPVDPVAEAPAETEAPESTPGA